MLGLQTLSSVAIALVIGTGIGYMTANKLNDRAALEYTVKQQAQNTVLLNQDVKQAEADKAEAEAINTKVKDAIHALPDPNTECLSSDDVKQLQAIWK